MLEKIDQIETEAGADLAAVDDAEQLERFRVKYLGSKGSIRQLTGLIKQVPKEQKPQFGQRANAVRQQFQDAFDRKKTQFAASKSADAGPAIDVTLPGSAPRLGRVHVITRTINELVEVFGRMGFDVATGPEVEDDYHNFVALNIPESHPARDPLDNFYLEPAPGGSRGHGQGQEGQEGRPGGLHLLRSQTSTIQIRVMQSTPPPVRVVAMGRVYRPDEHDATHYSMFHQVEGLYVDRDVSMVDLKTTLFQFAHAMFGAEADVRLRPSYFPFTEPSAELEVKIELQGRWQWMEIGGCGMVDPAVFEHVGYDPQEWTGFAFGLGIERLAMRKHGIEDIRWLFENDVRFLRQF